MCTENGLFPLELWTRGRLADSPVVEQPPGHFGKQGNPFDLGTVSVP